jgi:hypothetical protein
MYVFVPAILLRPAPGIEIDVQILDEKRHLPQTAHLCLWHPPELHLAREDIQASGCFACLTLFALRLTFRVNLDQGLVVAHSEQYESLGPSNRKPTAVFRFKEVTSTAYSYTTPRYSASGNSRDNYLPVFFRDLFFSATPSRSGRRSTTTRRFLLHPVKCSYVSSPCHFSPASAQ